MSKETYVPVTYVDKKIKEYFLKELPQYCEGEEAWEIHWSQTKTFTRPDDLYWMDFTFHPAIPKQEALGTAGRNRFTGFTQISINVPLDSTETTEEDPVGTSPLDICADDIARVFRRGVLIDGIRIVKFSKDSSALRVYDDFVSMPVSIYWWADLKN